MGVKRDQCFKGRIIWEMQKEGRKEWRSRQERGKETEEEEKEKQQAKITVVLRPD